MTNRENESALTSPGGSASNSAAGPSHAGQLTLAKCLAGAVNAALLTLLPLAGCPGRLLHPTPWLLFLGSAVILSTQPPLRLKELLATPAEGRSGVGIMVSAIAVTAAPVIEFGYRQELRPPIESLWFVVGLIVLVLGVWLRLSAIWALGTFFTAVVAVQPGQTVIDRGPYRLIRHPSYSGALLASLGAAIMCQSWAGLSSLSDSWFPHISTA